MNDFNDSGLIAPGTAEVPQSGVLTSVHQVLDDAISRQSEAVVSHRAPEGWRTVRTHLIPAGEHRRFLMVAPLMPQSDGAQPELSQGEIVGVTFRHGHKKCMFNSEFLGFKECEIDGQVVPGAWWLSWPEQIQQLQRRVYYRIGPPPGRTVPVKLQGLSGASPSDSTLETVTGTLLDLSAGGIRVCTNPAVNCKSGDAFRIVFSLRRGEEPFILEAAFRHKLPLGDGTASLGFQFVGLETTTEGQAALLRLAGCVTEFHRAAQRRRNLSDRPGPR